MDVQWLVTGQHKLGGMKGRSCSFAVSAPKSWSRADVLEKARYENNWAVPLECRRIEEPPQ